MTNLGNQLKAIRELLEEDKNFICAEIIGVVEREKRNHDWYCYITATFEGVEELTLVFCILFFSTTMRFITCGGFLCI